LDTKQPLQLHLPPQAAPTANSFDARPRAVRAWVAHLPWAAPDTTARLLHTALAQLNRLKLRVGDRYKDLETLAAPVCYAVGALQQELRGKPLPLQREERLILERVLGLLEELAIGYQAVVAELLHGPLPRGSGGLMAASATQRALHYLDQLLLRACQCYCPDPPGFWWSVHQLYHGAEAAGLHERPVPAPKAMTEGGAATRSVGETYRRILLLALADPRRLRPGEVERVHSAVQAWVGGATLHAEAAVHDARGLFTVDLDRDAPPQHAALADRTQGTARRILDLRGMVTVVRAQMDRSAPDGVAVLPGEGPSQDLLRRLMRRWGMPTQRGFSRIQRRAEILAVIGLDAVYKLAAAHAATRTLRTPAPGEAGSARASFRSLPIASELHAVPDLFEFGPLQAPNAAEEARAAGAAHARIWLVENLSAAGYRLLWRGTKASRARVGELLSIREPGLAGGHWGIGVIRWLRSGAQGLEVGVQMLAPYALAVLSRARSGDGAPCEYRCSLLLPELRAIRQPATLITPSFPYRTGATVDLRTPDARRSVILTRLVEHSGPFNRFEFQALADQGE
jgi:cyclic-di-GMP-binding protein